ncbi:hypothetical protein BOTBODRAFT_55155 [Botryobasidium botryosum FD-172 SS1]|uniref:Uncharacterized protein n=1 Tax=Botryobasidium botryosum (strain FD-172 SS1) TaxID=930990 RepID=A0A067MGE8_BOTB1|nr:hypothetical protein BOTBODRAFT_55155 [Botryobasidium botryosum FD-172 SS1]
MHAIHISLSAFCKLDPVRKQQMYGMPTTTFNRAMYTAVLDQHTSTSFAARPLDVTSIFHETRTQAECGPNSSAYCQGAQGNAQESAAKNSWERSTGVFFHINVAA